MCADAELLRAGVTWPQPPCLLAQHTECEEFARYAFAAVREARFWIPPHGQIRSEFEERAKYIVADAIC